MLSLNFFQWVNSNGKNPKEFEMNKYTCNSSKCCVLEVDFEYHKELRKLHDDYPLAPNKIEIKKGIYNTNSTQKRIEAEKNGDKDGKALYKLMNIAVYGKTRENLRNRIDVRLVSNQKD